MDSEHQSLGAELARLHQFLVDTVIALSREVKRAAAWVT